MYIFKKEKVEEFVGIPNGVYEGTLIDIVDTYSKPKPNGGGNEEMLKLTWKIYVNGQERLIYDHMMPKHSDPIVREIALKKMSRLVDIMLSAKDGEDVNFFDCKYKKADLAIVNKATEDGREYPRIKYYVKSVGATHNHSTGTVLPSANPTTGLISTELNDDIPF